MTNVLWDFRYLKTTNWQRASLWIISRRVTKTKQIDSYYLSWPFKTQREHRSLWSSIGVHFLYGISYYIIVLFNPCVDFRSDIDVWNRTFHTEQGPSHFQKLRKYKMQWKIDSLSLFRIQLKSSKSVNKIDSIPFELARFFLLLPIFPRLQTDLSSKISKDPLSFCITWLQYMIAVHDCSYMFCSRYHKENGLIHAHSQLIHSHV